MFNQMPALEELVRARPGDNVSIVIAKALEIVKQPSVAYAYFQHNGVIVTVDKASTPASAHFDWQNRLSVLCKTAMEADK
jgi:hypothetical protein